MPKDIQIVAATQDEEYSVAQRQSEIQSDAQELWLDSVQVSALRAIINWKLFISASQDKEEPLSQDLIDYFDTYGFSWDKRLTTNAIRWQGIDDEIVESLLRWIQNKEIDPVEFCDTDPTELRKIYPWLSPSKIGLLQNFVERESYFDSIDYNELSSQFPFPITKSNFFGRFIGWIEWSPLNWVRHLRSATPFFIQVKSLIEGLQNPGRNYFNISALSQNTVKKKKEDEEEETLETKETRKEIQKEFQQVLEVCIEQAKDMLDDSDIQKLTCISIPMLPQLSLLDMAHIEPKEMKRLAVEIMEWIFFGDASWEILNRSALSIQDQKAIRRLKREIPSTTKKIRTKKSQIKAAYIEHEKKEEEWKRSLRTQRKCETLEEELQFLQMFLTEKRDHLRAISWDKKFLDPLIKILDAKLVQKIKLNEFRKQVQKALAEWEKIVFTTFDNDTHSILAQFYDKAFAQKKTIKSEVWDILNTCAFLMSDAFAGYIRSSQNNGTWTWVSRGNLRPFHFDQIALSQSARYVVQSMLPQKQDVRVHELTTFLIDKMRTPWVSLKAHMHYNVGQYFWKKTPNIDDYLEYTFEHLSYVDKDTVLSLLNILRDLWHTSVPQKCIDIARERFHLAPDIFDQFSVYTQNYTPATLWKLPWIFEDRATLDMYLSLWLDSYGMSSEIAQLEKELVHGRWIVGVIDTTEYHPELVKEDAFGDKEESSTEDSDEVWWEYVRPTERLMRALSSQVMEWRITDDLENYSFIWVKKPSWKDKAMAKLIRLFFGVETNLNPDISKMSQVLSELHNYDENTILIVNAESVKSLEQYKELITLLEKFKFKVIVQLREPLPGLPQVTLKPFLDSEITERIMREEEAIRNKLWLTSPISAEVVSFAVTQVKRMRNPSDDPLNLTLQVINGAAQNARMQWHHDIREQDIAMAISPIFHLPDSEQMKSRLDAVENFIQTAPLEVLWQAQAVKSIWAKMKSHILWLRDPSRPLSLLLPGPTGVGKTELMIKFAQAVNMPFFQIEWAEFSEEHTVSRLVGSPTGYKWPDKWILFKFLENNNGGVVFIDEIEKMHPAVYIALMNFFDKATLTAGDGTTVKRPGFVIVWASNAWADTLNAKMNIKEVKDVLSQAFVDQFGKPRPELVRRFDPVVMLAIEQAEFKQVIKLSLKSIWNRFGLVNANIRLHDIDDSAIELLYNESLEVCKYSEESWYGFQVSKVGEWVSEVDTTWETFYDMRHVSRALDSLVWDGLVNLVQEQIVSWRYNDRDSVTKISLQGNKQNGKVDVVVVWDIETDILDLHWLAGDIQL